MRKKYIVPNVVCISSDTVIMAASPGNTVTQPEEGDDVITEDNIELGSKKSTGFWEDNW